MARTKNKSAPAIVSDALPQEVVDRVQEDQNATSEHREAVLAQFGDGLPYDRARVVTEAKFFMAQSAEAMLEAGKRLILIKEHEPHGGFIEIVENELGLAKRTAQLMMQAAAKYLSPKLQSKAQALALLGKSKLFELLTEDDDELAALAEGGTVAGMALDDIERMTCRELRAALRESEANLEARGELLAHVSAERDQAKHALAVFKRRIKTMPPDEAEKELRREAATVAFGAEVALTRDLREVCNTMLEHAEQSGNGTDYRGYLASMFRHLELKLLDLRQEFDLPDNANPEDFSWLGKEVLDSIQPE